MYVGNYTDPRVGLGFKFSNDEISLMTKLALVFMFLAATPDWIHAPILLERLSCLFRWEHHAVPALAADYSWEDAPGWGEGWHHVGTGVTFAF